VSSLWWCWTENEPSTFRCRERLHDVREFSPGTPVGSSNSTVQEQSTSARLREVQGALAASQADLTRVERQYAETREELRLTRLRLAEAETELTTLRGAAGLCPDKETT